MPEIPIFDSLTHPMPDGNWLDDRYSGKNTAAVLRQEMEEHNVPGVLAVGMGPQIGGYAEGAYAGFVRRELPGAHPVAYFQIFPEESETSLLNRLQTIRDLGYVAIKIHPRFAAIDYTHPSLPVVINLAHSLSLPVLLCTYNYGKGRSPVGNSVADLVILVQGCGEARVILLHGGVHHLLELAEYVRSSPGVLLDLSFTLCRYAGSSLDLDISHLFEAFDQRICVGSDHPQFSLAALRQRFDLFAEGLPLEKARNIAHANLLRTLNLPAW